MPEQWWQPGLAASRTVVSSGGGAATGGATPPPPAGGGAPHLRLVSNSGGATPRYPGIEYLEDQISALNSAELRLSNQGSVNARC